MTTAFTTIRNMEPPGGVSLRLRQVEIKDGTIVPAFAPIAVEPGAETIVPVGSRFAFIIEAEDICDDEPAVPVLAVDATSERYNVTTGARMTTEKYRGFGYEQASREADRLLKRAVATGDWFSIVEKLIELRSIMRFHSPGGGETVAENSQLTPEFKAVLEAAYPILCVMSHGDR